jgi:hypothetical protein
VSFNNVKCSILNKGLIYAEIFNSPSALYKDLAFKIFSFIDQISESLETCVLLTDDNDISFMVSP